MTNVEHLIELLEEYIVELGRAGKPWALVGQFEHTRNVILHREQERA